MEKIDVAQHEFGSALNGKDEQNREVKQLFVILKQIEPKEISSKHSGIKRLKQQQKRSSDQTVKMKRCSYCDFKSEISKLNQDNHQLSHQLNQLQERLNYLVTVVEEVTAQQVEQVEEIFQMFLQNLLSIIVDILYTLQAKTNFETSRKMATILETNDESMNINNNAVQLETDFDQQTDQV